VSAPATLSLCMIVKDEAELLPRFLDGVRGLWTELRVVDTGSTDASVAICEAAGAEVLRRPWDDDFSAARNAGLARASGDWILVLDADEMISPELVAQIKLVLEDPRAGAATVVMRNLLPHGHRRDTAMLRLFRNHPAVRFSAPIHEDVTGAVRRQLAEDGRCLRHLPGVVEHLGYVRERATARNKKARDGELLTRCLERDPADYYSWFKLLELARFWGDGALSAEAAAGARRALDADGAGRLALAGRPFGGELVALMADGLHPGDAAGALRVMAAWAGVVEPSAALFLRRAELHELAGEAPAARADFERCLGLASVTADQQLATVRPLMGLARLAVAAGDAVLARRHNDEALRFNARDPEALFLAALLCRARGGAAAVGEFAAAWRAEHGDHPELHEALGEAALATGRPAEAVSALRVAAGHPPAGRAAIRLAQALLACGDLDGARHLASQLTAALPEAAVGLLVCDLIEGRDSRLVLEVEDEVAHRALRAWVDVLRDAVTPDLNQRLRRAAPAVAAFFPWLPKYLGPGPRSAG
jgi:tetratricopeptide (TPR) repeat protein